MKLKAWLSRNKDAFRPNDLRFLLKSLFKQKFPLGDDVILTKAQIVRLGKIRREYAKGVPLAYSLGKEEFYGLEFKINKNVLAPRPETEILVERALAIIEQLSRASQGTVRVGAGLAPAHCRRVKVLDLCCGSGVIAVVIKKFALPQITVTACDISKKALGLARANARAHKVAIRFVQGDLFAPLKNKKFDLIVSNPPYVAGKDIKGSLLHEPRLALYAAGDGLAIIKKIITQAVHFLNPKGGLMIEAGFNQRPALDKFLAGISHYSKPAWIKDYSGHNRVLCLNFNDKII